MITPTLDPVYFIWGYNRVNAPLILAKSGRKTDGGRRSAKLHEHVQSTGNSASTLLPTAYV